MYVVQCPKCQERMKVKKEMHQVKVRCAKCKGVFLAETEEIADSPAAGGGKSRPASPESAFVTAPESKKAGEVGIDLDSFAPKTPKAPAAAGTPGDPKPKVLRKQDNTAMYVVIGGGVLCIVFLIFVIRQAVTDNYKFPDGHVERLYKSEIAELLAKAKEEENAPPPAANSAAPAAANTASHGTKPPNHAATAASTNPYDDMPPGEGPDAITVENTQGINEAAIMADKDKDKIQISKNLVIPNDQDPKTGVVVVDVLNVSKTKTIKKLELSFQIMNKINGKDRVVGHTNAIKLEYCPPNATMRYSVTYQLDAVGRFFKPVMNLFEYAPDDTVSWMITDALQYEKTPTGIKVTGTVKNDTPAAVRDVKIYATFFDSQKELIGQSEPVGLQDNKTLLVKEASGRFIITFDTRSIVQEVKDADIRLVGSKG